MLEHPSIEITGGTCVVPRISDRAEKMQRVNEEIWGVRRFWHVLLHESRRRNRMLRHRLTGLDNPKRRLVIETAYRIYRRTEQDRVKNFRSDDITLIPNVARRLPA